MEDGEWRRIEGNGKYHFCRLSSILYPQFSDEVTLWLVSGLEAP
jgi:hypothetical protein